MAASAKPWPPDMATDAVEAARGLRYVLGAVADFEKWPQFLEKLARLFITDGANLRYFDPEAFRNMTPGRVGLGKNSPGHILFKSPRCLRFPAR